MPSEAQALASLRSALRELAAADAQEIVREARAEARARVRELLCDALSEAMLAAVDTELHGAHAATPHGAEPEPEAEPAGEAGPVRTDEPAAAAGPQAVYVYGVIASGPALGDLPPGIDGRSAVCVVEQGGLTALVSQVARADFDEERLREHLADIGWVEETARRHELVLEAIGQAATVIPMRMCTVYSSEAGVRELLRSERRALSDALDYLDGKTEWGVKVFSYSPAEDRAGASIAPDHGARARGPSGAAYMQRRLRERDARAAAAQQLEAAATQIHEALCTVAADAVIAPPQRPQLSGRSGEMVLNGVYLVGDEARDRFHARARALAEQFADLGLELECTGPWPAYNFVPGTIGAAW